MVYLLTGETNAAERAIATMQAYRYPGEADTFHVYFTLTQFALAYDWLHAYEGCSEIRARVGRRVTAGGTRLDSRTITFSTTTLVSATIALSHGNGGMMRSGRF